MYLLENLQWLYVDWNRKLQYLPDRVGEGSALWQITAEDTAISTLPEGILQSTSISVVSFPGTPLCREMLTKQAKHPPKDQTRVEGLILDSCSKPSCAPGCRTDTLRLV